MPKKCEIAKMAIKQLNVGTGRSGVNLIDILRARFLYKSLFSAQSMAQNELSMKNAHVKIDEIDSRSLKRGIKFRSKPKI